MGDRTVTINRHEAVYDIEYVENLEAMATAFGRSKSPESQSQEYEEYNDYKSLAKVLQQAFEQASTGKGKERHARGNPFEEQHMQTISRLLDSERGMAFQAIKKLTEGLDLPNPYARKKELLGAINYIAGIVIYYDQQTEASDG